MYTITDQIRTDVRNRMFAERYAAGTRVQIFICPKCGNYVWSTDARAKVACGACDAKETPMIEENMTL